MKNGLIPEIEKAIGRKALVSTREDDLHQFRIVAEESLDETKGAGKWREWIRGRLLAAGAPCVKVSPIVSPICPERYAIYSVTVLMEERMFLPCAERYLLHGR